MSDVTRQPGGTPAQRDRQIPDTRGEAPLGTTPDTRGEAPLGTTAPPRETQPAPGARADHAAGARSETAPGLRTDSDGPEGGTARSAHGGGTLVPHDALDELGQRLQHAVAGFVDAPRASVEEADRVLEEITARFTDAVTHRRRSLRTSWHDTGADDRATSTDTEQLRLALRDYRELSDRLMRL
ncbi:hypothetical protein [Streptomyces sp. NPDC017890]|uniref:hypothetical protein n=1 Tax=Streptomyces sp. NPDC017890 TaxID=3365015 RepID=UPI0037B3B39A